MGRYASSTDVSAAKSREEIDTTLQRYGATAFSYGWEETTAVVHFKYNGKVIRFILPMPDAQAREFTHTPDKGLERRPEAARAAWEQATRQRWRALALAIKAKLEMVDSGITSFEEEFLAHIVMPDGRTVGQHVLPAMERALTTGSAVRLLGPAEGKP